MLQGFLLGLSTGATCLAYCAPVLVPYLLGEAKSIRQTAWTLSRFMLGRLLGYLVFAVIAWLTGSWLGLLTERRETLLGSVYILLAALLLLPVFFMMPLRKLQKNLLLKLHKKKIV